MAIKQMTEWGMTNGHLEPWDFGHEGWSNEYLAVHVTTPYKDALVVEALGWTPGTQGRVTAQAFNLVTPEGPEAPANPNAPPAARGGRGPARLGPTQDELTAYLESVKSKVAGGGLVGRPIFVPVNLQPAAGRMTDDRQAAASIGCESPACATGRGGFTARGRRCGCARPDAARRPPHDSAGGAAGRQFLFETAALRISDAGRPADRSSRSTTVRTM